MESDTYFDYNQIKLYPLDVDKTVFMIDEPTYYYQVMPFSLKNVGVTYQQLMDRVFTNHISHNLEVYVDYIVVKSPNLKEHIKDLEEIILQVQKI
ncbi:Retrovirus-related Pol polyprotein from transposon 17.6, partial [Mucuna pruriens]